MVDGSERKRGTRVSRRGAVRHCVAIGVGAAISCVAAAPARAGWGTCSRCACAGFQEDYRNHEVCSNCGHNYTDHW